MFNFFNEIKSKCSGLTNKINFKGVLVGENIFYIEGVKNILKFSQESISVRVPSGVITIEGEKLCIKEISTDTLCIHGNIKGIERL